MDYNFCNSGNNLLDNINSILSEYLFINLSKELITERCQEMITNFNIPFDQWERNNAYKYASYSDMAIPIEHINDSILSNTKNIGIDFPTWFNFLDSQQSVMLVGMEPLRRYDLAGYATVSSPFALHHYNSKRNPSVICYINLYVH